MTADPRDFCKVQHIKDWLGLKTQDADGLLQRLITSQSLLIEDWLSMPILSAARTETYDGTGTQDLVLRVFPVTAVAALAVGGVSVPAASFTFDDLGVHLVNDTFPQGRGNVSVTYTAGYAEVPPALQQACIELVSFRYRERDRIGVSVHAIAQGNTTYSLRDFPPQVLTLLQQYKRVTP